MVKGLEPGPTVDQIGRGFCGGLVLVLVLYPLLNGAR